MIVGERTLFGPWVWTMLQELRADQQQRWQRGDKVSVDAYVRRHPELVDNTELLCDLILGEILLREGLGEQPRLDEYVRHFPKCADRLSQRYRSEWGTALPAAATLDMPGGIGATLNMSPSHGAETIQLDTAGQLAAQQEALVQGAPSIPGYLILSELGRGGMGVVYRAKQLAANRDVALKVVRNDLLDTLPLATRNSTLARFRHEAHAAARLEHDNLVPVYDVGEAGGLRYYAMRFVDGTSLYDMLRNKALSNQEAARYIEPVARGLHSAHEQGVLHRDLKPHNIIVESKSGRPMLTDFGLAKFLEERNDLTHAGDVMGTPSYMSPEQARDSGQVTALADVYSLGATLYHVLTSRPPFQAANIAETIRQVLDAEPVAPRRLNPAIDRDLETICLKCLQKEPARRYESALALADDLKRYLNHEPILARPAGMVERTWRWCRRNPRLAGMAAVASLLLVFWVTSMVSGYYKQIAAREKDHFLINDMFTEISEDDLLNQPGMQKLRGKLLGKALAHYQELLQESGGSQWLQDEVAGAHFRIGVIRQQMGQYDESRTELVAAAKHQQRLLDALPTDPQRLEALSDTLTAMGKLHSKLRELPEATNLHAQADALRDKLVAVDSTNLQWQRKLASARANLGLAELDQGRSEIKREHSKPGQDLQRRGREHIREAQEIGLRVLEADPNLEAARRELAMSYFNLGKFDSLAFFDLPTPRQIAQASDAVASFQEAIKYFQQLNMKELANRSRLATVHLQLGGLLVEAGDLPAAQMEYEAARPLITALALGNPDVLEYQLEFVSLAMIQGDMYERQRDVASAQEAWKRARDALADLLQTDPKNYRYRYDLATALDAVAEDQHILGNVEGKISTLDAVLGELKTLLEQAPDEAERKQLLQWESQVKADREAARATLEHSHTIGTPLSNPPETADKNQ